RNQALKQFRQRGITLVPETSGAQSPEHEILRGELERIVRQAVLTLPEPQREVLILAHYEQLPLAEVAAIIGIEVGAVKSRLQRARAARRHIPWIPKSSCILAMRQVVSISEKSDWRRSSGVGPTRGRCIC